MSEKKLLITNGLIVGAKKIIRNEEIFITDSKIKEIGRNLSQKDEFRKTPRINAKGNFVSPGFIDIHIHGRTSLISENQARFGTTLFLRALSTDEIFLSLKSRHAEEALKKNAASGINNIAEEIKKEVFCGAKPLGLYLEGPFISKVKCGAQDKRFILKPDKELLRDLFKESKGLIKIITLAPELPKIRGFIKAVVDKGAIASLGHSNASFEEARSGIKEGIRLATHLFNAMSGVAAREPGCIAAALLNEKVFCEIILDCLHLHPELFRLALLLKGIDKIILVTDSIDATDFKPKRIKKYKDIYRTESGVIAGSNLTLNIALKNSITFGGVDLVEAIKFVALNPAKLLNVDKTKGSINIGKDADIVIFDRDFDVKTTIVEGNVVFTKDERRKARDE